MEIKLYDQTHSARRHQCRALYRSGTSNRAVAVRDAHAWRVFAGHGFEQGMKDRGVRYEKALLPVVSNVMIDGRLITGQNPGSARKMAATVANILMK